MGASIKRKFFLPDKSSFASSVKRGAMMHSTNKAPRASTEDLSKGRFKAIILPKAETGSQSIAALKAIETSESGEAEEDLFKGSSFISARPQGVRCFTTTAAGFVNIETALHAASASRILL